MHKFDTTPEPGGRGSRRAVGIGGSAGASPPRKHDLSMSTRSCPGLSPSQNDGPGVATQRSRPRTLFARIWVRTCPGFAAAASVKAASRGPRCRGVRIGMAWGRCARKPRPHRARPFLVRIEPKPSAHLRAEAGPRRSPGSRHAVVECLGSGSEVGSSGNPLRPSLQPGERYHPSPWVAIFLQFHFGRFTVVERVGPGDRCCVRNAHRDRVGVASEPGDGRETGSVSAPAVPGRSGPSPALPSPA